MFSQYGLERTVEPPRTLPVLAWKLDNSAALRDHELRVRVTNIHLEAANFKQLSRQADWDEERMKAEILTIVNMRGKLHNPYTNTAGIVAGVVEEIGPAYENQEGLKVGEPIVALYSLSMIPLHIEQIRRIDYIYGNVELDGWCILYSGTPLIRQVRDISLPLLMVAFEESASLHHVHGLAAAKEHCLVVGSNVITSLLYGSSIRRGMNREGRITALLSPECFSGVKAEQQQLQQLIRTVFDEVLYLDLSSPLPCSEALLALQPQGFDLSINCAEVIGGEATNVLVAQEKGTVFFSSLINSYNIALFLTEGLGKELEILCADGYARDYNRFMFDFLAEIAPVVAKVRQLVARKLDRDLAQRKASGLDPEQVEADEQIVGFVAKSRSMQKILKEAMKAAKYDCAVLIQGETGVGKEKIADLIHNASARKMKPCIKINCAAIPVNLMESEFFGYEKGAFTGAGPAGKKGYFELADKGVLFLDEVEQLPLDLQAKLLRVLQDKTFYSLGGQQPIHSDFRVIAAANKDLQRLVQEGQFREDLYYRLCVLQLNIPPLRNRQDDILPLTEYFFAKYCERYGFTKTLSDEAGACLQRYSFPGNIRELENLVQRLLIQCEEPVIDQVQVLYEIYGMQAVFIREEGIVPVLDMNAVSSYQQYMEDQERNLLYSYLRRYGTTRRTAEALHMSQAQFMRRKKKYKL